LRRGRRTADGGDAVVVQRKAAGTLRIVATGQSAHSGSQPDKGRNALLALAAAAQAVAACHDPAGPERLTAVPTVVRAGDAFNVVPASGELTCDVRADRLSAFDAVMAAVPASVGGATLTVENLRRWPGMDSRAASSPCSRGRARRSGGPIAGHARGGASDASHFAARDRLTIDGLGPLGGGAHAPPRVRLGLVPAHPGRGGAGGGGRGAGGAEGGGAPLGRGAARGSGADRSRSARGVAGGSRGARAGRRRALRVGARGSRGGSRACARFAPPASGARVGAGAGRGFARGGSGAGTHAAPSRSRPGHGGSARGRSGSPRSLPAA
jgi:hypothetical protein